MRIRRIITYSRAVWGENHQQQTLERALRRALDRRPDANDTRISVGDGYAAVCDRRLHEADLFLHIVKWPHRLAAATVPHADGPTIQLDYQSPGEDWDYWSGSGMVMVRQNHCLVMGNQFLPAAIGSYLRKLLIRSHGGSQQAGAVRLEAVADHGILETIRSKGVKQIRLHLGQYLDDRREWRSPTVLQRMGNTVGVLLLRDWSSEQMRAVSNVNARLVVKIDARRKFGITAEQLRPAVEQILSEDDENIDIETMDGQIFRRGNLIRRKQVEVNRSGNTRTVDHLHAWHLMEEFMYDLYMDGELD